MFILKKKLDESFFLENTVKVSKRLIGKTLQFKDSYGIIIETEAYRGKDDPACHAAKGKTKRTEVMFGQAGYSYVYLIYGMYHCLNIVTEAKDFPAAVLIRGIILITPTVKTLDGPGKLCRELNITREQNNKNILLEKDFCIWDTDLKLNYDTTSRIGISKGQENKWRFAVSKADLKILEECYKKQRIA